MFLGRVSGHVVATGKLPSLDGATFRIVTPENEDGSSSGPPLVAVDIVSASLGDLVYLVKGKEATMPWVKSKLAPIDAAIVGIVEGMRSC